MISASPFNAPDETGPIRLPVHGSTVTAEDLRTRLVFAADFEGATEIDASGVESVGQAVLQLLVAANREARQSGQPFSIHNPSPAFVHRVVASRLADEIGLEIEKDDLQ
nr:STAS domain-containing protein [Sphingomonas aerophila]